MMEYRVRSKRSAEWIEKYKGAQVTQPMINLLLNGPARIFRPDGKLLAVYLPGAAKDVCDETYPDFSKIRGKTDNRGYASGSERVKRGPGGRSSTMPVASSILGSFDRTGASPICRLTAFNAKEVSSWTRMLPLFQRVAALLEEHVPDRYANQAKAAAATHSDWIIPETPFTTITVNNTYPTGIHTDKGDLDEGFSTLVVMRRGNFTGGWLTFPQYGIAANMQDGDVLLMDAHDWHGNTPLECTFCGKSLIEPGHGCYDSRAAKAQPERVSVVSYFRTRMVECASLDEEQGKLQSAREAKV